MWYIEFNSKAEDKKSTAVSVVEYFRASGEQKVFVWLPSFNEGAPIELPFSYEDFKTIFTEAARKHEIPDFRAINHENLRSWLADFKESGRKRHRLIPRNGEPFPKN